MSASAPSRDGFATTPAALRWSAAAAFVLAIHGAILWFALDLKWAEPPPLQEPAAIAVDLAPPAAPPDPLPEAASAPEEKQAPPSEAPPDPSPTADAPASEPKSTPAPSSSEPAMTAPAPPPSESVPPLAPRTREEPKPQRPPERTAKRTSPAAAKRQSRREPPAPSARAARREPPSPAARRTAAPAARQTSHAAQASIPAASASVAPPASPSAWKSELAAHLERYKRFPPGAARGGVASIAFTISRAGQVLSSRLVGSSGDPTLDAEAVALPRRASPVPAPPPGYGGGSAVAVAVPVRFNR